MKRTSQTNLQKTLKISALSSTLIPVVANAGLLSFDFLGQNFSNASIDLNQDGVMDFSTSYSSSTTTIASLPSVYSGPTNASRKIQSTQLTTFGSLSDSSLWYDQLLGAGELIDDSIPMDSMADEVIRDYDVTTTYNYVKGSGVSCGRRGCSSYPRYNYTGSQTELHSDYSNLDLLGSGFLGFALDLDNDGIFNFGWANVNFSTSGLQINQVVLESDEGRAVKAGSFTQQAANLPATVPEPGTLALLTLGLVGVSAVRRRNKVER